MRPLVVLGLIVACTASSPRGGEGQDVAQEMPPTLVDADEPLKLADGELLRLRRVGGSCSDTAVLVVYADGRFSDTSRPGCWMGKKNQPPAEVKAGTLSAAELERLQALLADPALMQSPADVRDFSGSAHPSESELVARTPTGEARTQYTRTAPPQAAALDTMLDELYSRLHG